MVHLEGGNTAGRQAGRAGDKAQEPTLVGCVQCSQHTHQVAGGCRVPSVAVVEFNCVQ